jgi:hypothetical protein
MSDMSSGLDAHRTYVRIHETISALTGTSLISKAYSRYSQVCARFVVDECDLATLPCEYYKTW